MILKYCNIKNLEKLTKISRKEEIANRILLRCFGRKIPKSDLMREV